MARTPPHRSKLKVEPKPPDRDENGRLAKGNTANPGGLTKAHRAYRLAFLERVPRALELIDEWMKTGADPEDRRFAVQETLARGLGKHVKPSELPSAEEPKPLAAQTRDTEGLLAEVRGLLAAGLAGLKSQHEAGDLTPDALATLGRVAQDLGYLQKAEAEAARASKMGGLTVDELLEIICAHTPLEQVAAALQRRLDTQAPEGKTS